MSRLNDRAWKILRAEVEKCAGKDALLQVQRDIVFKRLNRLREQDGNLASYEELRDTISDVFPNFSDKVLKKAAKANRPPGAWHTIKWVVGITGVAAGTVWVLNLPYPMIRWPVARTAPILLLPSYMKMDYDYRQAIVLVEQADQLVNRATSQADLLLGEQKVKQAQKHLDGLPVWFLGYQPQYRFWFGWNFTLDEFRSARANVGRMEAKVFQEKQAQTLLEQGEQALNTAKQQHDGAKTWEERQKAIAAWQVALDQLQQLPQETLAGRGSQMKIAAYERDFRKISTLATQNERTGTLMDAARQFAMAAAVKGQNPPHSAAEWQEVEKLWDQAIDRLEKISLEESGYLEAQKLLITYQGNLGIVKIRQQAEESSVAALTTAKREIENLLASNSGRVDRNQMISQIQSIIYELQKVQTGTTVYKEAQELMQSAQKKLKEMEKSSFGN
ncbi:hypothetical protein IQ264_31155 [Phormidium sp. LEGE 05292]|uniref:hypothetical protein n=1 Tax=[Phormidium] sp. LEGE 05292 TaxID=767427 RepID=UPI00187F3359|nr:hypothetical protein [Phormidium sp. LEGE 05292]MBE9229864.1 hypothetical protein [Phormidium sp. LEGE 05292]